MDQETRLYDSGRGTTRSMRSKEDATTTATSPTPTCCRWCWTRRGWRICAAICRNCRTPSGRAS
ncbi:MAG: hypothetical protein WDN49_15275 [Acetobacteraceae bacterium]